jgi:hypothetical protein
MRRISMGRSATKPVIAPILQVVSRHIDARQFDPSFPASFPRFVQHAVWRYCAQNGRGVCNGNRIDDRQSCDNIYCQLHSICDRNTLKISDIS